MAINDGDKDVAFRITEATGDYSKRDSRKYKAWIDGLGDIKIFCDPHDLVVGTTYIMETIKISQFTTRRGEPCTSYFANGLIAPTAPGQPALQPEAPPKRGDSAPDVYETLRGIVKIAKGIKDFAQDEVLLGDTKFDPEDIRTMMIEAFKMGATMQMIIQDRKVGAQAETDRKIADEDGCPF